MINGKQDYVILESNRNLLSLFMKKLLSWLLPAYVFLLPWQARWIFAEYANATPFYGGLGIYATDLLFVILLIVWIAWMVKEKKLPTLLNTRDWRIGLLFLFTIFALISIGWAFYPEYAFYSWLRLVQAIFLGAIIFSSPLSIRILYLAVLGSGVIQSFFALFQFLYQEVGANTLLGTASQEAKDLGVSVIHYGEHRWLRPYGLFPHPNILGGFLSVAALIASAWFYDVYLQMKALTKRWDEVTIKEVQPIRLQLIASLSSFVFLIIGLLLTFSRTAWVGFAVGWLMLTVLLIRFYHKKEEWKLLLWAGIKQLIVIIMLLVSLSFLFGPLWTQRFYDTSLLGMKSVEERVNLMDQAQEIIAQHPIRGTGIGSYVHAQRELAPDLEVYEYQPVHNTWLLLWAELGVIGLLPFFGFLYALYFMVRLVLGKQKANVNELIAYSLLTSIAFMLYLEHYWWTLTFGMLFLALHIAIAIKERFHFNDE